MTCSEDRHPRHMAGQSERKQLLPVSRLPMKHAEAP